MSTNAAKWSFRRQRGGSVLWLKNASVFISTSFRFNKTFLQGGFKSGEMIDGIICNFCALGCNTCYISQAISVKINQDSKRNSSTVCRHRGPPVFSWLLFVVQNQPTAAIATEWEHVVSWKYLSFNTSTSFKGLLKLSYVEAETFQPSESWRCH